MEAFFHISFFHNIQNVFAGNHRCIRTGGSRKLVDRVVEHREAEHPFLMPKIGKFLLLLLFFCNILCKSPPVILISLRSGSRANLREGQLVVGALKNFQRLVTRVRCLQQFQIHFRNKQHNFEIFSPDSYSSKGCTISEKGAPDLLQLVEGGATSPS